MTSANRIEGRDQADGTGASRRAAALRAFGEKLWSYSATRGGAVFIIANLAGGIANFIFHVIVSRLLGPNAYGAFGALLNVTSVATIPLGALSLSVAQSVARSPDPTDTPPLRRLLKFSLAGGVGALALWLAATPAVDRFFHLHTPDATIVLGLWLVPAIPGAVLEGVVLGQRRFRVAGIIQMTGTLSRLTVGVVLVELGLGVVGAMAATLTSGVMIVLFYAWVLRQDLLVAGRFVPKIGDTLFSTVSVGGASLLTIMDAWLARHFLAAHAAGFFVAAATAGNIVLFLPAPIVVAYFPRFVASAGRGHEARQVLVRATGLVTLLGFGTAVIMALVPGLVVGVLFGPTFAHAQVAVGTVALADAGIGVAGCLIYYHVARGSKLALAAWPTCLVALFLAAIFHGSIEVLALDMLVASTSLVLGLGVPTLVVALRSLAEDTASLPREAILLDRSELDLTVVVPFKDVGAERLAAHVRSICETLAEMRVSYEVIPVSDGSTDGSETGLVGLPCEQVRPIVLAENRGKGEALRIGLAHGQGHYLGFIDGDGDIPATALAAFVEKVRAEQPDLVVGSKRHRDAEVYYPPLRRVYSAGYQLLCAVLFGLRTRDTQTGVKLVRRDVVGEILPRMVERRFAFDLELLAVAHRIGYRQIAELPVAIGERFPSTISPVQVWRMLQDTLATFWRLRMLRFYDPPLVEPSRAAQAGALARTADVSDVLVATGRGPVDELQRGTAPPFGEPGLMVPVSVTVEPPADLHERLRSGTPLRILILNMRDLAHPDAGAAEVYTHRIARVWVEAGHQVTWFCAAVARRPSLEEVDGITVVRRGGRHSVYKAARTYWARQGQGRFDLVIDEVNTRPFGAARWGGHTSVVALVRQVVGDVWCHELRWPLASLARFLLEPVWLRRLRTVPVLTVSRSSAASLARYGLSDVTVVPEVIDSVTRPKVAREATPTIMVIGAITQKKSSEHALEAFRLLRREVPGARLWMVGSGAMAKELGLAACEGVDFLGRLDEDEKRDRLARVHCLVVTSVSEGCGLIVTEAAQVGTPTIAYDMKGLRDSVAASRGLLVAPNPEALAEALVERLPGWAAEGVPPIEPDGVESWPTVAEKILESALARVTARRGAGDSGEDVVVAWRRAVAPLATWCDRRTWSVAGIAALVTIAPLSEAGAASWAELAAGLAMGCFVLAVLGTWADAVRWPLASAVAPTETATTAPRPPTALAETDTHETSSNDSSGFSDDVQRTAVSEEWACAHKASRLWHWPSGTPVALIGILVGAIGLVVSPRSSSLGGPKPALGNAWVDQLGQAYSLGRVGAPRALVAVLQLPLGATGMVLHALGASEALNEQLWVTVMFAAVAMAMTGLLLTLGFQAWAAVVGAAIYSLSPYVFTMSGLAVPYLAAMAVVPGIVAWVLVTTRCANETHSKALRRFAWLLLLAIGLGLVAGSPPLLLPCGAAFLGAVLLVGWIEGRTTMVRTFRYTATGVGILAVLCAYWAVPFGMMVASSSAVSEAAHRHWQWASTRSALANSFWLNTAWNWGNRVVFPEAPEFHQFPLVLWRYALPITAFAAFGVTAWGSGARHDQQRLRLLVATGIVGLLVLVLATGSRSPGVILYSSLMAIPYGWLLQDPGRFLFVAGAAYAILVASAVDQWTISRTTRTQDHPKSPTANPIKQLSKRNSLVVVSVVLAIVIPVLPFVTDSPAHPVTTDRLGAVSQTSREQLEPRPTTITQMRQFRCELSRVAEECMATVAEQDHTGTSFLANAYRSQEGKPYHAGNRIMQSIPNTKPTSRHLRHQSTTT